MKKLIFWWVLIFSIIALAVYIFTEDILALGGVGLAAVISLAISIYNSRQNWRGTIVDIKMVQEERGSEENVYYEDVSYAFLKLTNGKQKKLRADSGWNVGDVIVKEKGKFNIRVEKKNNK